MLLGIGFIYQTLHILRRKNRYPLSTCKKICAIIEQIKKKNIWIFIAYQAVMSVTVSIGDAMLIL